MDGACLMLPFPLRYTSVGKIIEAQGDQAALPTDLFDLVGLFLSIPASIGVDRYGVGFQRMRSSPAAIPAPGQTRLMSGWVRL